MSRATIHPVLVMPSAAQAVAMGKQRFEEQMALREQLIALERNDPLRHGWEPPIWTVCRACGFSPSMPPMR